ncbi:hypothetical protein CU103_08280 [Phyllobacterium sophorae]|uniref:Uncharacterized protein n=1 Tax=Phyllobacterium sophorae TaxID=1520277 RepID=A0A2P7BF19_9HYPH|nr:hypothetical protein CU103_08280 [Phyllobacterium sophorae]
MNLHSLLAAWMNAQEIAGSARVRTYACKMCTIAHQAPVMGNTSLLTMLSMCWIFIQSNIGGNTCQIIKAINQAAARAARKARMTSNPKAVQGLTSNPKAARAARAANAT